MIQTVRLASTSPRLALLATLALTVAGCSTARTNAGDEIPECQRCHGQPPAPATGHPVVASDLPGCSTCHPLTVKPDGTIDVAGGHHMNGVVEVSGHGDFSSPATHGSQFFQFLAGASGALDCTACHGATYDGGFGPSCNDCHASAGWTASWQTNCSFCHGTRNATTQAGYAVASHPAWAAPPDALAQRLDPAHAPIPSRTGAHQAHLTGTGSTSGKVYAAAVPCATCHTVPADFDHAGGPGRAPVVLKGTGTLPADLGAYAPATGTCTTYCHGNGQLATSQGAVVWTAGELGCAGCHGNPPASGKHAFHVTGLGYLCSVCHTGSIDTSGAAGATHLDGVKNVVFISASVAAWNGTTCTATCHTDGGQRPWN